MALPFLDMTHPAVLSSLHQWQLYYIAAHVGEVPPALRNNTSVASVGATSLNPITSLFMRGHTLMKGEGNY